MEKEKIQIQFRQKGGVVNTDDTVSVSGSEAEINSKYNGSFTKQLNKEELEGLISKAYSLTETPILINSEKYPPSDSMSFDIKITDGAEEINIHTRSGDSNVPEEVQHLISTLDRLTYH